MIFFKILLNLGLVLFLKKSISYQPSATMISGVCGCQELLTVPVIPTDWNDILWQHFGEVSREKSLLILVLI